MSDVDAKVIDRTEHRKGMNVVGFTVDITPKIVVGNEVFCEIDPGPGTPHKYVKGGVIKFPVAGQPYTATFQIMPGDVPNLQFDPDDPFWSSATGCPTASENDPQLQPQVPCSPTSLDVDGTPSPPKNLVYYRLNFLLGGNPLYCDPIIINN